METNAKEQPVDIQQYWLVLKRRWPYLAAVFIASVGLAGFAVLRQKPEYQASGMLLFESDRISSLTKAGEKLGDLESLMREGNPLDTQAVILNSQPILKEVINRLGLKDPKGQPLNAKTLKIQVEPIVGTDVLKVSYTSEKPQIAAAIVNQLMSTYVENNIQSKRVQAVTAGEFIKRQIPSSRRELEKAAEALRKYKDQNKIIQLPLEAQAAIENIAKLDEEINQGRAKLAELRTQEGQIGSQLKLTGNQAVDITSLSQIPGVQDVLSELQKVQTKLAAEQARYRDNHPSITFLQNQEKRLNSLLSERVEKALGTQQKIPSGQLQMGKIKEELASKYVELQSERQGTEQKIQALTDIRTTYQQRLAILPSLEKSLGDLELKLSVAQTDYQNLVKRLQEIEVAEKQTIGNARVIQPAEIPDKPILSKLTLLLVAGGVFVGLLMGVTAAFIVDTIDTSLKTVKEVETFFGYTLLGLIPKFDTKASSNTVSLMGDGVSNRVVVASSPRTVIYQAYQMLQANLKFISHKKVSTIVVTSSVAGEGKSEVSANLAAIIAQTGRRVLLVDADMRQPSQHHLWGLINTVGLSNIIVGQEQFNKSVKNITENFSVLTAGVIPPNPLALIDSQATISLIETFSQQYDYIIFDTPPLAGTADAAVLGKMVDGVLLVARPHVVDSASASAAKSLLERSEANILGIVANGVNIKQEPDSYFYYSALRGQSITETEKSDKQWANR